MTAAFLLRDLRTAQGGFASALDADAAGEEGSTYVWSPAELVEVLGAEDGAWAAELLGVTAERHLRARPLHAADARRSRRPGTLAGGPPGPAGRPRRPPAARARRQGRGRVERAGRHRAGRGVGGPRAQRVAGRRPARRRAPAAHPRRRRAAAPHLARRRGRRRPRRARGPRRPRRGPARAAPGDRRGAVARRGPRRCSGRRWSTSPRSARTGRTPAASGTPPTTPRRS